MGEQQIREKQAAAFAEAMLGAVKPFNVYALGCPKCGRALRDIPTPTLPATLKRVYCVGKQRLNPDNKCTTMGEHLHCFCSCGYGWLEHTADWDGSEPGLLETS